MLRSSHDACGCSTQTTSTINLKRSTLHPHEGQADRPNTPSDSVNLGSNPGPPARHTGFFGSVSACADGPSVRAPITTRDDDSALCALRVSINTLDDGRGSMILACGDNEPMFA